jgi:hypothetical protein
MKLSEYERSRNPRGMHGWGDNTKPYSDANVELLLTMQLGWIKLVGSNWPHVAERCREAGVMPILRMLPGPLPARLSDDQVYNIIRDWVTQGRTRWIEIMNEPNLDVEWQEGYRGGYMNWQNPECIETIMSLWLTDAEKVIEVGGYPAFPALAPCGRRGREASINHYEKYFEWLAENEHERAQNVFANGAWFAIHPYIENHFYFGGDRVAAQFRDGQWHFEYPADPICQADAPGRTFRDDDNAVLPDGQLCNALLGEYFGLGPLPVIGTEGGIWTVGPGVWAGADNRYPKYDQAGHAEVTVAMFDWMAEKAPDWYFGLCCWILDGYVSGKDAWPTTRLMKTTPPKLRPEIETSPVEPPVEVHYRSHYVLFPQGTSWDWYEAASGYITHFRVTLGQSHDDAGVVHGDLGHTITAINPADDVLEALRRFDATLDVIRADTPQVLKEVLDARVETNTRFG